MDEWQRLTLYPLRWIFLGGLHPRHDSKFTKIQFVYSFGCFVVILALAFVQILVSYSENIYYTIDSILTIVLYLHIASKYLVLRLHKPTLASLLEQRSKFWNIDHFDNDIRKKCINILARSLTIVKSYLCYSLVVVTSFLIQPIITGQLPVFLYVPNNWYYFLFGTFYLITPAIMASIWGVDTIFYSISIPVSVQFKLLAHKFETLNVDNFQKKIKKLVDHHNFLIEYCKTINKMSSGIFLTQYLVAISTSCMQLFIASQPEFGFFNKIKCLSYFTMQIIETAIYCFTAELISECTENVGNAVYRSQWYQISSNEIRKDISLIVARSQNKFVFNGLGLVWIKMETFTQIFKTALSFYTYLNTMVFKD